MALKSGANPTSPAMKTPAAMQTPTSSPVIFISKRHREGMMTEYVYRVRKLKSAITVSVEYFQTKSEAESHIEILHESGDSHAFITDRISLPKTKREFVEFLSRLNPEFVIEQRGRINP